MKADVSGEASSSLTRVEQQDAIRTWRYLRLAMVAVVVALFAAIIADRFQGPGHCWQGSISTYYYTPVHGFLIGALVTIGVCLYCLKGNPVESVLLNLAGMFAPVIALVPTDPPKTCLSTAIAADRYPNAGNNMFAFIVLQSLALITVALFAAHSTKPRTKVDTWGYAVAAVVVAVEWILWAVFLANGRGFTQAVHFTAAVLMFVCIFLVVVVAAASFEPGHNFRWHVRHPNRYAWIAILMAASSVVFLYLKFVVDWRYAIFQIEASLILLFVAFWSGQTWDSWREGERERPVPDPLKGFARPPAEKVGAAGQDVASERDLR